MHSALIQNRQCRALALHARNVAIWTKSREKIYHGLRAVGNSLTTWAVSASSVVRNFSSGLPPRWRAEHWVLQKSRMLCISCRTGRTCCCWIYRCQYFNSRYFSGIERKAIKSYVWNIISWILMTTIPSRNVGQVCPVWCVRIPLRKIFRMFVTRNIGIINYCD